LIEVWRACGLDLLLSPLLEVLDEPILSYLIHTQFDYSLQNVQILVDVHPEALGGAVQGNDVALRSADRHQEQKVSDTKGTGNKRYRIQKVSAQKV